MKLSAELQAGNVLTVWDGKSLMIPAVGKISALYAPTVFVWARCKYMRRMRVMSDQNLGCFYLKQSIGLPYWKGVF